MRMARVMDMKVNIDNAEFKIYFLETGIASTISMTRCEHKNLVKRLMDAFLALENIDFDSLFFGKDK